MLLSTRLFGMLLATMVVAAPTAAAQQLSPIQDTDYAIDLFQTAVLGSGQIVGMGGASVAAAPGSAGMLANPAAITVRPPTSTDVWGWDFHVDWLNNIGGADLDNNGVDDNDPGVNLFAFLTAGLVGQYGKWAVGITGSFANRPSPTLDDGSLVEASTIVFKVAVGRMFFNDQLHIAAGARVGQFQVDSVEPDGNKDTLFSLSGGGLESGAVWTPSRKNYRFGLAASLPITGSDVATANCDPMDCQGFILPERVVAPWQLAVGWAYRNSDLDWNQRIGARWVDERYLLLAADVHVAGGVKDGYGIGAFAQQQLQRSGADVVFSVRAGAEYEWIPGWLRVRGGSYYEPSRFADVSGRLHGTAGIDTRVYSFCVWHRSYRLRFSLLGDFASGYNNVGVSLGFWN